MSKQGGVTIKVYYLNGRTVRVPSAWDVVKVGAQRYVRRYDSRGRHARWVRADGSVANQRQGRTQ